MRIINERAPKRKITIIVIKMLLIKRADTNISCQIDNMIVLSTVIIKILYI